MTGDRSSQFQWRMILLSMKGCRNCIAAAMTALSGAGPAFALSCQPSAGYSELQGSDIAALLVGSLACYPTTAPYENQEYLIGGKVVDYKKGSKDTVDPSAIVGTYSIGSGANAMITYSYIDGPSYMYTVWGANTSGSGVYDFCSGSSPVTIRVVAGAQGPC